MFSILLRIFDSKSLNFLDVFCKVVIKCPVTYVSIPVLDLKSVPPKRKRTASKFWGRGKKKNANKDAQPTKKDSDQRKIVWMQWPVISPARLFQCIIETNSMSLIQSDTFDWLSFWKHAEREDWGKQHPVHSLPEDRKSKCVGCTMHGDEGQGKRLRNILVLSWSSIAVHGPSELTKFPFAASWLHAVCVYVCVCELLCPTHGSKYDQNIAAMAACNPRF